MEPMGKPLKEYKPYKPQAAGTRPLKCGLGAACLSAASWQQDSGLGLGLTAV